MQFQSNRLCSTCRQLIGILTDFQHGRFEKHPEAELELSLAELDVSASEGCHLCSMLMAEFDRIYPDQFPNEMPVRVKLKERCFTVFVGAHLSYQGNVIARLVPRSSLEVGFRQPLGSSTECEDVFELASQWLTDCLDQHAQCSDASQHHVNDIPSRLIHINAATQVGDIRLSVRSELQPPVHYLALSHCWGRAKIMTLTHTNLSSLNNCIPWDHLSKTFQDAVIISRRLGYEYLWIDSLCIIQDSEKDWKVEASKMGDYYRNAVCAIAALGASDGTEGCFMSRNPLSRRPLEIAISESELLILEPLSRSDCEFNEVGRRASPLHKRAWVIQERLMAPRTLYYGRFGISWECRQRSATEHSPNSIDGGRPTGAHLKLMMNYFPEALESEADVYDFRNAWSMVLENYTQCHLTFRTDKLVALAGFTNVLQSKFDLTCCAGLWIKFLLLDLLWKVMVADEGYGDRVDNVAPSWSWASIDGHIMTFTQSHNLSPAINRVKVNIVQPEDLESPPYTAQHVKIKVEPWTPLIRYSVGTLGGRSYLMMQDDYFLVFHPDIILEERLEVWALPLIQHRDSNGREDMDYFFGLVLVPKGEARNLWTRVGQFEVHEWPAHASHPSAIQLPTQETLYLC